MHCVALCSVVCVYNFKSSPVCIIHICANTPVWFQAGIPPERLRIALESEVASLYCQNIKGVGKLPIHQPGASYVVADIGGMKQIYIFLF